MKTFWKVLGFAALAAGLTPYKVEKDEETGEKNYQALLWAGSSKPGKGEDKREILINLGEGGLTSKIMGAVEKKKEAHLFSDELSVEYTGGSTDDVEEAAEPVEEPAAEETSEAIEEAAEDTAPKTEE